ncbi:metal-dependent hydrolase [Sphingorhabdus sp.]|jgi:inner membrane protein|uniref:metal-dependent hydrolase n=1 Tax=Sphingorhabdus sp. TaxID=1902408 RepID=UPI003D81876D
MDNLTHSLVGALIGQTGLKRKTGLAMPTLIIAANIPDIDAVATLLGGQQHLALRRGLTHGPIAMLVLPLLLWGIMLAFDRWQTQRGKRPEKRLPVHKGWLLALAYIGCLSHPLFDWFNSYGIRLLEPFSSQWFYGDTLFIIDIWLWAALIAGVWISQRRELHGKNWRMPALVSFTAICAYILANGLITDRAEQLTAEAVRQKHDLVPALVVANPVPVQFWKREMLWRDDRYYGQGSYSAFDDVRLDDSARPHYMGVEDKRAFAANVVEQSPLLFWSRMPVAQIVGEGDKKTLKVSDQRFVDPMVGDRFSVFFPIGDEGK